MRRIASGVSLGVAVLVPTLLAASAGATTTRIPVTSFVETDIHWVSGPTAQWQEGNVLHIRGLVLMGHHFGSPYLQGWNTLTVNQNVNLLTGAVEQWGTIDWRLDGIDGITGGWTGSFSDNGGSATGYGSIAGWHAHVRLVPDGLAGYVFSPGEK